MSDMLPKLLTEVLNPENDYCAIVVDKPEDTKKIVAQHNLSEELIYPLYDLKECISKLQFDYLLFLSDQRSACSSLKNQFRNYGLPKEKVIDVICVNSDLHFRMKRAMQYYKEHSAEFEMFATGLCYAEIGLDVNQFKRKLFNFGRGSQDLYYDYQMAKFVTAQGGRGKYALINLAPYSFHYDLSKSYYASRYIFQYFLAFNDLNNYWVSVEDYQKFFSKKYLNNQLDFSDFDLNNMYFDNKRFTCGQTIHSRLNARTRTDVWKNREFFKTRTENIKILDDYLTLCEKNNITPIMFIAPATECYKKYFNKKMLNEFYYLVNQALKKHPSTKFFDGWKIQVFSDCFTDADHINLQGAAKFSKILNDFIEGLEANKN